MEAAQTELEPLISTSKKRKKNKGKTKRRFSDEQIRSLEKMFESETKLEPKRNSQLASELCLQPRQVAIWFQNRRARWKSKQTEQEYRVLRANYDNLASQFESLKEEKQSLLSQVENLSGLLGKPDGNQSSKDLERQSTDGSSYNWDVHCCGTEAKGADCLEEGLDYRIAMFEDNEQSTNIGCSEDIGTQYLDCSFTSPAKWCSVDSGGLFDWNF